MSYPCDMRLPHALQQINYLVEYIRRFEKKRTDAAPITAGIPSGTTTPTEPPAAEATAQR